MTHRNGGKSKINIIAKLNTDSHLRFRILMVIVGVSVVLRIIAALYFGNSVVDMPGVSDQVTYNALGIRITEGYGFTFDQPWWPATQANEPTAHWSYIYSLFVAGIYGLFGPSPLIVRILQAVAVGVAQPILIYLLGKQVFNPSVGILSAVLISLYAYLIYYAGAVMTESFYITTLLVVFLLALMLAGKKLAGDSVSGKPDYLLALVFGLFTGLAVLLRQVFLLFLPFLFLWILYVRRRTGFSSAILELAAASVILTAMIAPFTVYNYQRFDKFVLLNTNAGFAFYWGNHPVYGTRFESIITPETGNYLELLPKDLVGLNEAELDSALLQRALVFVTDDPGRYVLLSLSRIPSYFMFWPSPNSSTLSNIARILSFGLLWPFMFLGVIFTLFSKPLRFTINAPAALLLLFALVYSTAHILTWTLIRYRLPVDAVLFPFAAYAIIKIVEKIVNKRIPVKN